MAPIPLPLGDSVFTLDTAAVAGFFGGEEAISAMATVHLYEGRRWLGWYNSPGSYTIAKWFGKIAKSRIWDGLFPGPNDPPEVSFGLDGQKGPEYIAALSGTKMSSTGHLAYLTVKRNKETPLDGMIGFDGSSRGTTKLCYVGYLAMKRVNYETLVERQPLRFALLGLIPIAASFVTCVMCALVYDWFSFSMILLGIITSGLASFVIGGGRLAVKSVGKPAKGAPAGHGILRGDVDVVVIKGIERDVNAITKGCFHLKTDSEQVTTDEEESSRYHGIGLCSFLLLIQFLAQLLLIPQGHLFGQIMFITSLAVSWVYNSWLSSLEKERIQADLLFKTLGEPTMCRFRAATRTMMTVFTCLLLFHSVEKKDAADEERDRRRRILYSLIPNDTAVWNKWRNMVTDQLLDEKNPALPYLEYRRDVPPEELSQDERLLRQLLDDAAEAFRKYIEVHANLPQWDSGEPVPSEPGPSRR